MKKFVFGFPGQGSQKSNIGYELNISFPKSAGIIFNKANETLNNLFSNIVWNNNNNNNNNNNIELINQTMNAQPIILTTSIATLEALKEVHGFTISSLNTNALIGHSLGEYSCLVAAQSIDFIDALNLVYQRGLSMQLATNKWNKIPSMMAVFGLSWKDAKTIESNVPFGLICQAANQNGNEQTVLSGCKEGVNWGLQEAKLKYGAKRGIPLSVSCPFHSIVMKEAAILFKSYLDKVEIKSPIVPIIFNFDGKPRFDSQEIKQALLQGMYHPVHWSQCIETSIQMFNSSSSSSTSSLLEFREIGGNTLRFGLDKISIGKSIKPIISDVQEFKI